MRWPYFFAFLLMVSLVLMLFVEVYRAEEDADAQEILNVAIASYSKAPGSSDGEKYGLMQEVRTLLDRIVADYPSNELAEQIVLGETVGSIDIAEVDRVLAGVAEVPAPVTQIPVSEPITVVSVEPSESGGSADDNASFADLVDAERAETEMALDRKQRREIQRRLTLIGLDTKGVDGVFGPDTRNAIASWQSTHGLSATGFLDSQQRKILVKETQTAYANWQAKSAKRAHQRRASHQAASGGRYIGSDGCLREADGRRVPYFNMKCDMRGALRLK